ncbi:MAG: hypothetical protein BroJett040_25410 [Oligoflexia bacterium]|nr:MAG: hypothetical protein BroJett040_25410 [Oligoflexia bacterium]
MKAVALTLVITLVTAISAQANVSDCPKRSKAGMFANTNPKVTQTVTQTAPATQTKAVK